MDEVASLQAPELVAASPRGLMTGKNDHTLKHVMAQGYARYRAIGTKAMPARNVRVSPIDEFHCVAHVSWTATKAREGREDVAIESDVHYLLQVLDGDPKVFGWVSGDELAAPRELGVV